MTSWDKLLQKLLTWKYNFHYRKKQQIGTLNKSHSGVFQICLNLSWSVEAVSMVTMLCDYSSQSYTERSHGSWWHMLYKAHKKTALISASLAT